MNLFLIGLVCAIITGTLFYSEHRGSHSGIAELPTTLVTLGFTLRLIVVVLMVTILALSVGAI